MNTWTKLKDGSWGIRVEGTVAPGESVVVSRKDGSVSTVIVGSVVWSGGGISLATVVKEVSRCPVAAKPAPAPARRYRARFVPCGYPGCSPEYCDECDGQGRYGASW